MTGEILKKTEIDCVVERSDNVVELQQHSGSEPLVVPMLEELWERSAAIRQNAAKIRAQSREARNWAQRLRDRERDAAYSRSIANGR